MWSREKRRAGPVTCAGVEARPPGPAAATGPARATSGWGEPGRAHSAPRSARACASPWQDQGGGAEPCPRAGEDGGETAGAARGNRVRAPRPLLTPAAASGAAWRRQLGAVCPSEAAGILSKPKNPAVLLGRECPPPPLRR